MRVTVAENSERRLALVLRPVLTSAYWVSGACFVLLGLVVVHLMARAVEFDCERRTQSCGLTEWRGIHVTTQTLALDSLVGANVITWHRAIASGMRLMVITKDRAIPIDLVQANGDEKDSLARAIRSFASSPTVPMVRVYEDARPLGWALGLFLVAAGIVCIAAIEKVTLVMDRARGDVRIIRQRWLLPHRSRMKLVVIAGVESSVVRLGRAASWEVTLTLTNDARIALTRMPMFTEASAKQVRELIEGWLEDKAAA